MWITLLFDGDKRSPRGASTPATSQGVRVRPETTHHDHEIVRVADDPVGGSTALAVPVPRRRVARGVPFSAEVLIQRRQRDVGEQRGGKAALRGAPTAAAPAAPRSWGPSVRGPAAG